MIKFSRNNLKYQNVRSPPEHTANGNVHMDILLLHNNMSFKTIFGGFNDALSDGLVYFLKFTKIILGQIQWKLYCGFKTSIKLWITYMYKLFYRPRQYMWLCSSVIKLI